MCIYYFLSVVPPSSISHTQLFYFHIVIMTWSDAFRSLLVTFIKKKDQRSLVRCVSSEYVSMKDLKINVVVVESVLKLMLECVSCYKPLAVSFYTDAILQAYGPESDAGTFMLFFVLIFKVLFVPSPFCLVCFLAMPFIV